jgi:putative transposase
MEQQSDRVRTCYKYKLTPTPAQEQALEAVLSCCRTLDNVVLEQRTTWWGRGHGKRVTYYQQATELPDVKVACPEYAEAHSQVLHDVLRRVNKTYQAFFRRIANGETSGYPRFQGANRYHSLTYPQYGNGAVLDGSILRLSKIGRIPCRLYRPLVGIPTTVTISREADGWYACISCAEMPIEPLPPTGRETGIDVGLRVFLSTAAGDTVETPHHYRKAEKRLAKAQRHVARRTRGSHRRAKAVGWLRRTHQQVQRQRQRRDFHHRAALNVLRADDTISLEGVQVRNLVRNHHLAKRISDAAWRQVRTILAGKAGYAGRRLVAVPAHYTSQDCSGCGQRVRKSLSVRTHVCPRCGLVLDRDLNAARNMLAVGQHWAGQALWGLAGVPAGKNREAPPL